METILKTAAREVRVSAGGVRAACNSAPMPAIEFVRAILERYAGGAAEWPGLELVLKETPAGVTLQNLFFHTDTQFAPRLELTVASWASWPEGGSAVEPLAPAARVRIERELRTVQTDVIRPAAGQVVTEQLVHRLITRGERIEAEPIATPIDASQASSLRSEDAPPSPTSVRSANGLPSPSTPVVPPVQQIVRRLSPVQAEHSAQAQSPASKPARTEETRSPGAWPLPSQAPIDVNRLTDQVIQAIDRRIIAQRERLGRS